jgi:hypothetical protein
MHTDPHPLAGKLVLLNSTSADPFQNAVIPAAAYRIEDWWDHLTGKSWTTSSGDIAAMHYAMRARAADLPIDEADIDEVVYGKIGAFGHLVHVSELGPVVPSDQSQEAEEFPNDYRPHVQHREREVLCSRCLAMTTWNFSGVCNRCIESFTADAVEFDRVAGEHKG